MPDWLADPERTLLLILGAAAVAGLAAWWHTRRRMWLITAAVAAAALGALLAFDHFFASDRERIGAGLQAMSAAAGRNDLDAVFAHISESFRYGPTTDKKRFRQYCDAATRAYSVTEVVVWDFRVLEFDAKQGQATVTFKVKVRGSGGATLGNAFYLCKADFVRDPDGAWRMQTFQMYPPTGYDPPLLVPGLG